MSETRYMISDASKQLHVEAHVLRYWEDELQMEIPRTELGHRYYTDRHLLIFQRIKQLKDTGYQLKAIKLILPKLDQLDQEEFEFISLVADEMNRRATEVYGESFASPNDAPAVNPDLALPEEFARKPETETAEEKASPTEQVAFISRKIQHTDHVSTSEETAVQEVTGEKKENEETGMIPRDNLPSNVIPITRMPEQLTHEEKMQQFQNVMTNAVSNAMQLQAQQFGSLLSEQVSEKLLTELDYLLRIRQEQEELRFQKLDETIRSHQKSMQEAAASRAPSKRKRRK